MDLDTVDHLLTTTHSVKKRLDFTRPVEPEVIERCIEIALHSPTGANYQGWHFMVLTDPKKRAALADLYRKGRRTTRAIRGEQPPGWRPDDLRAEQHQAMADTSNYLDEHLHEVPVLIIACIEGQMEEVPFLYGGPDFESFYNASVYGSILPAAWSLMLGLRARGVGSAWTTAHLVYEKEAAAIVGIPDHIIQAAMLPVAYFKGSDFKPAKRRPAQELTHWNTWGQRR